VRRLVEQVRGSAVVESNQGTVWTIKIPVEVAPLQTANVRRRKE
jgi:two-component sensor histidine kinase